MNTNIFISDVARAAGVNKSTVSRVLNGKSDQARISPDTRNRIIAVARQMGYKAAPDTRFHATTRLSGKGREDMPSWNSDVPVAGSHCVSGNK